MQFSKYTADLARNYNIDPKDVLFALLATSGASTSESYFIVFRPPTSSVTALATRARNLMKQKPGLAKLVEHLNTDKTPVAKPNKAGKVKTSTSGNNGSTPVTARNRSDFDYTDKDAILKELIKESEITSGKERAAILMQVAELQRMKLEVVESEQNRVKFYVPLTYSQCDELLEYLKKWNDSK